jgi:hypothetical protein
VSRFWDAWSSLNFGESWTVGSEVPPFRTTTFSEPGLAPESFVVELLRFLDATFLFGETLDPELFVDDFVSEALV